MNEYITARDIANVSIPDWLDSVDTNNFMIASEDGAYKVWEVKKRRGQEICSISNVTRKYYGTNDELHIPINEVLVIFERRKLRNPELKIRQEDFVNLVPAELVRSVPKQNVIKPVAAVAVPAQRPVDHNALNAAVGEVKAVEASFKNILKQIKDTQNEAPTLPAPKAGPRKIIPHLISVSALILCGLLYVNQKDNKSVQDNMAKDTQTALTQQAAKTDKMMEYNNNERTILKDRAREAESKTKEGEIHNKILKNQLIEKDEKILQLTKDKDTLEERARGSGFNGDLDIDDEAHKVTNQ